jgi:hypothetical protein
MNLIFFIGWVLLIFVCSDVLGSAVQFSHWELTPRLGTDERDTPVEFVHSTLLGFAALWVSLSAAYAIGIATRQFIVSFICFSTVAALLVQYERVVRWSRSRLIFWGLIAAVGFLASFVPPRFSRTDDPEYFFLAEKLLRTGSVVEYFNYRRPLSLGGWTLIQAIFSSGPAGVNFVASLDVIIGSILYLFCGLLNGLSTATALPIALSAVGVVQVFQVNLSPAISVAALAAILISSSLPLPNPKNSFTPVALAAMACAIRPQLGLIAMVGTAISFWRIRNQQRYAVIMGAAVVGFSGLWLLIFWRDTGLLPFSKCAGTNPALYEPVCDPQFLPLVSKIMLPQMTSLAGQHWVSWSLTILAFATCTWTMGASRYSAAVRNEFRILGIFSIATIATAIVMIATLGSEAILNSRYYMPLVEGFLYVFLVRGGVHIFYRKRVVWYNVTLPPVIAIVALCLITVKLMVSTNRPSFPTESSGKICGQLLTPDERQAFEQVPHGNGYALLQIDCPVGSFQISPRVMMSDLFWSTRGAYFDAKWDAAKTLSWLQKNGVGQVVYLDKDQSWNFGLNQWLATLGIFKAESELAHTYPEIHEAKYKVDEAYFEIDSLGNLRRLAEYCDSTQIPTRNPQGPLIIIDINQCQCQTFSTLEPRRNRRRSRPSGSRRRPHCPSSTARRAGAQAQLSWDGFLVNTAARDEAAIRQKKED